MGFGGLVSGLRRAQPGPPSPRLVLSLVATKDQEGASHKMSAIGGMSRRGKRSGASCERLISRSPTG